MKVVYILHSTIMGGATISFVNMLLELKNKYGIAPCVICPCNIDLTLKGIFLDNGILYMEEDIPGLIFYSKMWVVRFIKYVYHCLKSSWILYKCIRRLHPDIIHTNTGVIQQGFFVSKLLNIPHVWHIREYQDKDFHMSFLPNKKVFISMLKQSYVISITNDILRHFDLNGSMKAYCIYNGVLSRDKIVYNSVKSSFFLTASRISPEKGFDDIIKAFCMFCQNNDNIDLKVLGFGDECYINSLKTIIRSYDCENRVQFLGYKSLHKVAEYMQNAKALIVGSYFEGFGRMTAEAIMSGCLVIGRNTGGTKEILDNSNGLRFSNEKELYKHMIDVAASIDNSSIIIDAQNKVKELFTIESNARGVYDLYTKILKHEI